MKGHKTDVLNKLRLANLGRNLFPPLAVATGIVAVGGLICLSFMFATEPETALGVFEWIMPSDLYLSLAVFIYMLTFRSERTVATAMRVDAELAARNRLEAALELSGTNHVLKDAQKNEASRFYAPWVLPVWGIWIALLALLYVLMASGQLILHPHLKEKARIAAEVRRNEETKADKESTAREEVAAKTKKKELDHAEIVFTAPDSETRAKPLDEIVWKAKGSSSCGFDKMLLDVAVNGEMKKSIPITNAPLSKTGEIEFDGSFYLEDLDVTPFDLVSYSVRGLATMDGIKDREVASEPQFVEVRPYREDAGLARSGGGGDKGKRVKKILYFMRREIALNKLTHAIQYSGLYRNDSAFVEQTGILSREQRSLADEVKEFRDDPENKLTANMFDCVIKAETNMKHAADRLNGGK